MDVYDGVFRVLSLVVVWAIPALLIILFGVFVVGAPALTLGGVVLRLYIIVSTRLRSKTQPKLRGFTNLSCSIDDDCPSGSVCVNGYCEPRKG